MVVRAPESPGQYILQITLLQEGVRWFDGLAGFAPVNLAFEVSQGPNFVMSNEERVRMTVSCSDSDQISKVANAGQIIEHDGVHVQVMHEGTMVRAGCYHSEWMSEIIRSLRGHHEPQEELIFHHLLKYARPNTLMIEAGAYWAYYTNWYLGAVLGSRAICLEPDELHMESGQLNLALNSRTAQWINAFVGREHCDSVAFRRESDGRDVSIPCINMDGLIDFAKGESIEMLHLDVQGAELAFIQSMKRAVELRMLRFVMVSTHHALISGSETTHSDCLRELHSLGAVILREFDINESFAGDGLIVASFVAADAALEIPEVSRNTQRNCLFGKPPYWLDALEIAKTDTGPILVLSSDDAIAQMLLEKGCFEEGKISEVTQFLSQSYGFVPDNFIDIGANIGTHLLHALETAGFRCGAAVEMNRQNFILLQCNVLLREFGNRVKLFNLALSDKSGTATMELSPTNFGDHRIRGKRQHDAASSDAEFRRQQCVETASCDELFKMHNVFVSRSTLIWMDTQGHEGHILRGSEKTLFGDSRPFIVVEFWPHGLEQAAGRQAFFEFLSKARAIHDINSKDWMGGATVSVQQLERRYDEILQSDRARDTYTDLLCLL
jgi:FkbM family methyltransferase